MSGIDLEPIVKLAQSGQLEAASRACDTALNADPGNPELVHLRGLLFTLSDRPGEAIPFIRRAIASGPVPKYWLNLGNALARAGFSNSPDKIGSPAPRTAAPVGVLDPLRFGTVHAGPSSQQKEGTMITLMTTSRNCGPSCGAAP